MQYGINYENRNRFCIEHLRDSTLLLYRILLEHFVYLEKNDRFELMSF